MKFVVTMRTGASPDSRIPEVERCASNSMSIPPSARSLFESKYASGEGQSGCVGRKTAARNGASASGLTIHGEIVVDKLLLRNGPSMLSQNCTSRADQSFSKQKPKMCDDAESIGIGEPRGLPLETNAPTSSSKSSALDGPKTTAPAESLNCPCGRRTSSPLILTELARPWYATGM